MKHNRPAKPQPLATTRRQLLSYAAGLGGAALLGPTISWGASPNATLNLAAVGVGGRGGKDLHASALGKHVRIVGLCDVDSVNLGNAAKLHPDAKTFKDYRVMLDKMGKDIDALLISTPDHMHGPIALAAMQLGIHVHVQKPLAHNIAELRAMQTMAEDNPKLVTQMGTQIHSHSAYRTGTATFRTGAIGKVSEAHLWVSRSLAGPAGGRPEQSDPVPDRLDWDLWLGVAQHRPYANKVYHPFYWRGWKDFGAGTLGDMGCHIFDPVFSCLDLGMPSHVLSKGPQHYEETFAPDGDIRYQFAPTKHTTDDFTFRWTDGQKSRPDVSNAHLPKDLKLPGAGMFLVGEKGVMLLPHINQPQFYRDGQPLDIEIQKLEDKSHYTEFTDACRDEAMTSTPFSYSARVTEAVLVGVIAGGFKDRQLEWDSPKLAFDHAPANDMIQRTYRKGWDALKANQG
ncbi:MAG: Gfo/Idh/MocA family oxidoreductase [Phycisphaeraceae bacterium]